MRAFILAAVLAAGPIYAADKQWTDAPVPGVAASGSVAPAERAGRSSGTDQSSPFSGIPSGAAASGGLTSSGAADGVGTPSLAR
ncbi:MAG: hypothetical protein NVSMB18_20810 [Acetobacteraceae bacterium]